MGLLVRNQSLTSGSHRATTANDNGAHTIKGLTPRFTGATQTTTPITANKTYEVQNIDRRNTLRNTSATDRHRHAATYASTNQLGPYVNRLRFGAASF